MLLLLLLLLRLLSPLAVRGPPATLSTLCLNKCGAPQQADSSSNRTSGGQQRVVARALQHSS